MLADPRFNLLKIFSFQSSFNKKILCVVHLPPSIASPLCVFVWHCCKMDFELCFFHLKSKIELSNCKKADIFETMHFWFMILKLHLSVHTATLCNLTLFAQTQSHLFYTSPGVWHHCESPSLLHKYIWKQIWPLAKTLKEEWIFSFA